MPEIFKRFFTGLALAFFGFWLVLEATPETFRFVISAIGMVMFWEFLRLTKGDKIVWRILGAIFYLAVPILALVYIRSESQAALLWLIAVIAATDIGAYLFGKRFGKTKIAPKISPNKTFEGLWGGMFMATFVGYMSIIELNLSFWEIGANWMFFLCPLFAILAQTGDFFESWLKRRKGMKDSSNLLPGHGGFLDRFDGLIFVSTSMAVLMYVF